jgi:FkbM family methyltransferase
MIKTSLKKVIYNLLCNKITGSIIVFVYGNAIPNIRWKGYLFSVKDTNMIKPIIASLFWGFYESSEIRFVEKYLKGDSDIIEMGGSCGVVSSHLVSKLKKGKRLISVEANKNLISVWQKNVDRHNTHGAEAKILNNAIYYDSTIVPFYISNNTTSSSTTIDGLTTKNNIVEVAAHTLKSIIEEHNILNYILICDIEGSEVQIFLHETTSFQNCQAIIIELHKTSYKRQDYSIEALQKLIETKGFYLKEGHGPVCYYEKITI